MGEPNNLTAPEGESSDKEYLVYKPDGLPEYHDILANKILIPPPELVEHLVEANRILIESEGPNQMYRQEQAQEWLGWWIRFLTTNFSEFDLKRCSKKLMTLDEVALQNGLVNRTEAITANFFANGLEGTPGHRFAISYIVSIINNGYVGVLLDEKISPGKKRDEHFLPLPIRLWMWAYYYVYSENLLREPNDRRELDYISVIPTMQEGVGINEYYNEIFAFTEALFHFVEKNDPHFAEKIRRNLLPNGWPKDDGSWFEIDPKSRELKGNLLTFKSPRFDSTTERVHKLGEDSDFEELLGFGTLKSRRTSDRAQRMMSSPDPFELEELLKK